MKKLIGEEMTPEESDQMKAMFNWANDNEEVMNIQLKAYKRYNKEDKHYHTVYQIESVHWIDEKWKSFKGEGSNLIEAMKNYSEAIV